MLIPSHFGFADLFLNLLDHLIQAFNLVLELPSSLFLLSLQLLKLCSMLILQVLYGFAQDLLSQLPILLNVNLLVHRFRECVLPLKLE